MAAVVAAAAVVEGAELPAMVFGCGGSEWGVGCVSVDFGRSERGRSWKSGLVGGGQRRVMTSPCGGLFEKTVFL